MPHVDPAHVTHVGTANLQKRSTGIKRSDRSGSVNPDDQPVSKVKKRKHTAAEVRSARHQLMRPHMQSSPVCSVHLTNAPLTAALFHFLQGTFEENFGIKRADCSTAAEGSCC